MRPDLKRAVLQEVSHISCPAPVLPSVRRL